MGICFSTAPSLGHEKIEIYAFIRVARFLTNFLRIVLSIMQSCINFEPNRPNKKDFKIFEGRTKRKTKSKW